MGLDITYYQHAELIEVVADYDDFATRHEERDGVEYMYANSDFPEHAAPLPRSSMAVRVSGTEDGFRAGSYSGYYEWRQTLAQLAHGVPANAIWEHPERYRDRAFFWLINFSDCEGIIGAEKCAILARDFAAHQAAVDAHPDEWFRAKYALWRTAFETAAADGVVEFH